MAELGNVDNEYHVGSDPEKGLYVWEGGVNALNEPAVTYRSRSLITRHSSLGRMVDHFYAFDIPKRLIAQWLHISSRQLERYIKDQSDELVKASIVERMALIDRLVRKGVQTFEDEASFIEWLKTPNYFLGDQAPISMLDSYFGIEDITSLLDRMEHSLPA